MKNQKLKGGKLRAAKKRSELGGSPGAVVVNGQREREHGRGAQGIDRPTAVISVNSVKRPPLERMRKIAGWLMDQKYPNCSMIARELEISEKSALRDIAFLRDSWGWSIEYDQQRHGFYVNGPVDGPLCTSLTQKEMMWLFVAQRAMEQYEGTPFQRPLEVAFERLTGSLDDRERFTLQNLGEALSFRPFAPDDADLREFELVTRAVTERRALGFDYRKPGEKVAESRHVHPYHVMDFEKRWYLLAHDLDRGEIRKFVLGRMRELVLTDERFVRPKDFDPKKHLGGSLGVMTGTGDYQVVIEMDAWLTDVLRGRRLHSSQTWTELPGGGSHLRMRLSCLEEIEQYVLSWGTHATVVGPAELRERVGKTAREVAGRCGEARVEG